LSWDGKKKTAIYLRRSKGEGGSTKAQLDRIKPKIKALQKKGKIYPVDFSIVGKDINKEETFNAQRDLVKKGDVFNDGEGASAFDSARERPVLNELLKRVKNGEYDMVIAESLDRYSRDPMDFALVGLDLWRKDDKLFWGLSDNRGYGTKDAFNEAIITTQLMWGGEGKKQESQKSIASLDKKLDRGFITSRMKAEFVGSGTKNAGLDYRRFWDIAQAFGETPEGRLVTPTKVGEIFGRDHTWAQNTYQMFKQWNSVKIKPDLTALEGWLNTVEAINEFILNQPSKYPKVNYKSRETQNLLSNSNGFINYPAGLAPSEKYPLGKSQFIQFPYPLDFDFEQLAITEKPNEDIPNWKVSREKMSKKDRGKLLKFQTQFRGKGGKGKRLV